MYIVYLLKEKNCSPNFESCKLDFWLFSLIEKKIIVMSTYRETLLSYEISKFLTKTIPLPTQSSKAWSGLVILYSK
jgi:hypothetical protein